MQQTDWKQYKISDDIENVQNPDTIRYKIVEVHILANIKTNILLQFRTIYDK